MCWGDSESGPVQLSAAFLPLSVLFRDSMTAVNYGWTLSASCWIESQQVGRAVGTTCACASAYGRRDAPSPVGLYLLCLDLSVSCVRDACRLRARIFHAQRRSHHFVFDTQITVRTVFNFYAEVHSRDVCNFRILQRNEGRV